MLQFKCGGGLVLVQCSTVVFVAEKILARTIYVFEDSACEHVVVLALEWCLKVVVMWVVSVSGGCLQRPMLANCTSWAALCSTTALENWG